MVKAPWLAVLFAIAMVGPTPYACAENYPSAPIKLVLPLAAGGATDNLARIAGNAASATLGQPIIIENRPGGGGSIASNTVAKAKADGYTLLLANFATHAVAPTMLPSLPYDPIGDFTPIALLASSPHVLMVSNDTDIKSVADLIASAKSSSGKLNFASSGVGSPLHLAGEYFNAKAGTDIVHVPYKSSVPALVDLMSGRVQMMFDNLSTGLPYVTSGRVRGLAVTSAKRSPLAPDLPSVIESGLPEFETYGWWGILAPANVPPEVVSKLSAAFMAAMKSADVTKVLIEQGYDPIGGDPAAFAEHIKREIAKWRPIIQATNIAAK
ncbi:MAG: Bug family tripartite tricarboxylate transporter substrate binding protein [Pseudorhodoplanes sp.]